jgi:hypothetical protein
MKERYYVFKTCEKTLGSDYDGSVFVIKKEDLRYFKVHKQYSDYPKTVSIYIGEGYENVRYLDFIKITGMEFNVR